MNLDDFITKKLLNDGKNSKCYLLQTGEVFKQFKPAISPRDVEKFKYFLNYKNESFFFPFEFLCDGKEFYGYISKRALGQTLNESFSSVNLEKLSTHSIKVEENIRHISEGGILIEDLHGKNAIYDGESIKIIDTDDYKIVDDDIEKIKQKNLNAYKTMICNLFVSSLGLNKHTQNIIDKINLYRYMRITASETIIKIKNEMEKCAKENVETVDDFNRIIRK